MGAALGTALALRDRPWQSWVNNCYMRLGLSQARLAVWQLGHAPCDIRKHLGVQALLSLHLNPLDLKPSMQCLHQPLMLLHLLLLKAVCIGTSRERMRHSSWHVCPDGCGRAAQGGGWECDAAPRGLEPCWLAGHLQGRYVFCDMQQHLATRSSIQACSDMLGYTPARLLNQAHLPGQDQPYQLRLCWARAEHRKPHLHHDLQTAIMTGQLDTLVRGEAMPLLVQNSPGRCWPLSATAASAAAAAFGVFVRAL